VGLYALQKAIYEYLNPKGAGEGPRPDRTALAARHDLTDAERDAFTGADVRALAELGVHPVLLNSFARASVTRDEYRAALAGLAASRGRG
jgi:hypothetical protein